jgi:hypothetical protein
MVPLDAALVVDDAEGTDRLLGLHTGSDGGQGGEGQEEADDPKGEFAHAVLLATAPLSIEERLYLRTLWDEKEPSSGLLMGLSRKAWGDPGRSSRL